MRPPRRWVRTVIDIAVAVVATGCIVVAVLIMVDTYLKATQ